MKTQLLHCIARRVESTKVECVRGRERPKKTLANVKKNNIKII